MSAARLFADNIYDAMRDAWATRVPATTPCPDAGALAALVDPAFQVSLQREEGRQIRCSAMLCSPTTTLLRETAAPRHGHTFTLSEPLSYSDQILRKIAGAYDASNAVLLVEFPRGGEPRIWGFGYYGSSHFREPAPAVITGYEVSWPDKPLVRIDSPGKLFLAQGDAMIGTLENGRFLPSIPTPLISTAMGNLLIGAISEDPGYITHGVYYWQGYNRILQHLLRRINQVSHGATMVVHQFEIRG